MDETPEQKPKVINGQCLWVVTEVYYPEEISTGYYLTSIAEGLAAEFQVRVLCGQPNYGSRGVVAAKHEFRNGVEIFRAASTRLDKDVILYRMVNMLTLGASMFLRSLLLFKDGDRVLVVTAPPSLPFTTALAALVKGSGYTLLLHDSYPEILVAVGKLRKKSFFAGFVNLFNRWLYKNALKIIVIGRDMSELMESKTRGLDIPIATIPNWADLETIEPRPRHESQFLRDLGIEDKFVFMYAGNIGHPTDVETIIDAARQLDGDDRFQFVFIGSGAKKRWLVNAVSRKPLNNVTILEQRPRSEQIDFLNGCDIGIISLVPGMWGTAMPSRTYNILAAGKPLLALTDEGSELARVIDEEKVGWHIRPGNPETLVKTICDIFERRSELGDMGARAYEAARNKYSLADAVTRYREELRT